MIEQRTSNVHFLRVRKLSISLIMIFALYFWWMAMNYFFIDASVEKSFIHGKSHKNFSFAWNPENSGSDIKSEDLAGQVIPVDFDNEYNSLACKFARLNPWDPAILNMIYHPRGVSCVQHQGNFTFVDYKGYLHLNVTAIKLYYHTNPQIMNFINCTYATFDRDPLEHNDRVITQITKGPLLPEVPVKLDRDMVEAACQDENGTEIYFNMHAHPCFDCHKNKTFARWSPGNLSVLMLMMDGTSNSVLKRHLTKTYDYIKNVMKFKIFSGYSKVGDNTFPNMMAAMAGYRYQYEQKDMPPDISENFKEIQFDHWPLAWKFFKSKGYATVFNEDKAEWGLFHYEARGFKDKPVDFFYHSYWYNIYLREYNTMASDLYCFRNSPKVERLLDISKRHFVTMSHILQFQYVFLTDLCHEPDGSEAERADDYIFEFLKNMHEHGYFDNTAILFFSDHGQRYSPVRSKLVGLLEERMPMFNVWFPPWFYAKYPHIERNLELNTVRLSSPFDVYQTLQDLANGNFWGQQRAYGSRGYSQLYPIPKNRTCFEAGVPEHHCTCVSATPLNQKTDKIRVDKAARALIGFLNHQLGPYTNICSTLTLSRVLSAEELYVNEKLALGVKDFKWEPTDGPTVVHASTQATLEPKFRQMNQIRLKIETRPMDARFEAIVEYADGDGNYAVNGDVSRLNADDSQSLCAAGKLWRKFCVCR